MVPAYYKFSGMKKEKVIAAVAMLLDKHSYKYKFPEAVSSLLVMCAAVTADSPMIGQSPARISQPAHYRSHR